jgi:kynurenine 3-monooxygenase
MFHHNRVRPCTVSYGAQESFPQLDIPALMDEQMLEAAVASRGLVFPRPQYVRRLVAVVPPPTHDGEEASTRQQQQPEEAPGVAGGAAGGTSTAAGAAARSSCGVALVGDAVHSFPPDMGQGLNCALQDALGLAQVGHVRYGTL